MNLTIHTIEHKNIWEDFINSIRPDTFLHSWNWAEFQKRLGHKIYRFGMYHDEILLGVASIILMKAKRGTFLFCPHGPIIKSQISNLKTQIMKTLTDYLVNVARKEQCGFIRISPLMEDTQGNNKLFYDLGFRDAPIHLMHPEIAWILDITVSPEQLLDNMRKTTRYSIKRAQRDNVQIIKSENINDLKIFWDLYRNTFQRQKFIPFSFDYLKNEFETFLRDKQVFLYFAKYKNEIISSAFVIYNKYSGYYHHGASINKYQNITASHLLQWEAILEAKKRGCCYYNFWGIAPENIFHHPWAGLSLFKRGFGGFLKQYVHCKDYIIKPVYFVTYIIEKIRRWKRRL